MQFGNDSSNSRGSAVTMDPFIETRLGFGVKDMKNSLLHYVIWKLCFLILVAWFDGQCIALYQRTKDIAG